MAQIESIFGDQSDSPENKQNNVTDFGSPQPKSGTASTTNTDSPLNSGTASRNTGGALSRGTGTNSAGAATATARSLVDQAKETAGQAYEAVTEKAATKLDEQKSTLSDGLLRL